MTTTWSDGDEPEPAKLTVAGRIRFGVRAFLIIALIAVCLLFLLLLRLPRACAS